MKPFDQENTAPVAEENPEPVVEQISAYSEEPQEIPAYVAEEEPQEAPASAEAPAPVPEAPKPAKEKKPARRKPHIALRILLQLLSFVMALVLCVALLGTVVAADLNRLISADGLKSLISAVMNPQPAPQRITGVVGAGGVLLEEPGFTIPDLEADDIPEDILTGGGSEENISDLVGWLYEQFAGSGGEDLNITEEQVQQFVQASTVAAFMAEKLAGYAQDYISGTANTTITTDEIMGLLEENEALIKETFDIEFSQEAKEELRLSVDKMVVENDLNGTIRQEIFDVMDEVVDDSMEGLQELLQLGQSSTLYTAIGICVAILLILCLLNFYNVPAGLTWASIPCILLGGLLTAALSALSMVGPMLELPSAATGVLLSFADLFMPIHSGLLWIGVGMLVISIVWRVIRANVRRKA